MNHTIASSSLNPNPKLTYVGKSRRLQDAPFPLPEAQGQHLRHALVPRRPRGTQPRRRRGVPQGALEALVHRQLQELSRRPDLPRPRAGQQAEVHRQHRWVNYATLGTRPLLRVAAAW